MSDRELQERRQAAYWIKHGPRDAGEGRLDAVLPEGWPGRGLPIRLPIEHFSPPGSFPVDETCDTYMSGFPAVDTLLFTYSVPQNQVFRITHVGWDADDDAGMASLRWTAYANSNPVSGLVNQIAGMGTVANPLPVNVTVPGSATFTILGTNTLNLYGWTYVVRVVGYLFTARQ